MNHPKLCKISVILMISGLVIIGLAVFMIGSGVSFKDLAGYFRLSDRIDRLAGRNKKDDAELVLRIDKDNYTSVHYRTTDNERLYKLIIVARLENHSKSPVILGRCYPAPPYPFYRVMADESGASAYEQPWGYVENNDSIVVQPGETRADTLQVSGPGGWRSDIKGGKRYEGRLEGKFRLVYNLCFYKEKEGEYFLRGGKKIREPSEVSIKSEAFTVCLE
jgi:hypothetical protein